MSRSTESGHAGPGALIPPLSSARLAALLPHRGRPWASGERQWRSITWAYCAYVCCFLVGSYLHKPVFNIVGAGAMTGLLLLQWPRFFVAIRSSMVGLLAVTAFAVGASSISSRNEIFAGPVVKFLAVLFLIFLGSGWRLRPLAQTRARRRIMVLVVTVLAISIAMPVDEAIDARLAGRTAGVFVNPNNFALTAMLLIFCLDEERDGAAFFWVVRGFVLAVILATGTSGALLAYAVDTTLLLLRMGKRWAVGISLAVAACGVLALVAFDGRVLPEIPVPQVQRLQRQLKVVAASQDAILHGAEVDFYAFESELGVGVTSGLWRLVHWRRLLGEYWHGSRWQLLFGNGLDSVRARHRLPHNDYVRVLYELGIVGLVSWLATWIALYRRARPAHRGAFVMVAVYCFTENNLDNFLFMSLFALFAASAARGISVVARPRGQGPTLAERPA